MTCGNRIDLGVKHAKSRIKELEELRIKRFNEIRFIDSELVSLINSIRGKSE